MATQHASVHVPGNFNNVNVRNEIHKTVTLGRVHFADAELNDATPESFETPPITERLVATLEQANLLVIAGAGVEDKSLLARHLAWIVQNKMDGLRRPLPVKEWNQPKRALDVAEELRKLKPAILLLPHAQPHQLGHDLRRLHEAVCQNRHLAILTTEATPSHWNVHSEDPERAYWHTVQMDDIYPAESLIRTLLLALDPVQANLPRNLLPQKLKDHSSIFCDGGSGKVLTVGDIAIRLRTPQSIRSFVKHLCSRPALPWEELRDLLVQFQGGEHGLRSWYRRIEIRQQFLALGLSLFEGLFDDQVFAALEALIATAWRLRDPSFAQFEYHELASLEGHFQGTELSLSTRRIEARFPKLRTVILEAAWEAHRRHILATLPLLTEILSRSISSASHLEKGSEQWVRSVAQNLVNAPKQPSPATDPPGGHLSSTNPDTRLSGWQPHSPERELFGTPIRADQLCGAIGTTLSEIGWISFDAVEPVFLQLASDKRDEVRAVVAAALARWRSPIGRADAEHLFEVLNRWQDEASLKEKVHQLGGSEDRDNFARIRSTVILTVSFAAEYDSYNQMTQRMCDLIEKLVDDPHELVRAPLQKEVLPRIVAMHPQQLDSFLQSRVVLHTDLLWPLARGLAKACIIQPKIAMSILDRWYKEARAERTVAALRGVLSARESILMTVLLTYGYLDIDPAQDRLLTARIFGRLRSVLAEENHPDVRRAVLWAAMLQARGHFTEVSSLLQDLAGEITLDEREHLIGELTILYLSQRAALSGGDSFLVIENHRYPIWKRTTRPWTEVERILQRWIGDDRRPVAQQLAFDGLSSFLNTSLDQKERELPATQPPTKVPFASSHVLVVAPTPIRTFLREPTLFGLIAIYYAAYNDSSRLARVRTLFPELLYWCEEAGRSVALRLLARWREQSDPEFPHLAQLLEKALWFFQQRNLLITGALLLFISLLVVAGKIF